MRIKIGIIGAGFIAGIHSGILARDERVKVSSIHDVVPDRAQQLARAHDATVASTADEVIDRSDAVFITTPNTRHVPLALAAVDAGKHVFCEKPLATAADASWLFPFERVEVFCHHVTLVTREMESLVWSSSLEGHFSSESMQQTPREEKWGYVQEDRAFVDSIVNGTPPLVTAFDGLMSVEIANAVYESVRQGSPVQIRS
jgi:predicted dehydrogenase